MGQTQSKRLLGLSAPLALQCSTNLGHKPACNGLPVPASFLVLGQGRHWPNTNFVDCQSVMCARVLVMESVMQSHCAVPSPTPTVCPAGEEVSPFDGIMSSSVHPLRPAPQKLGSERRSPSPSDSAVGVLRFTPPYFFWILFQIEQADRIIL